MKFPIIVAGLCMFIALNLYLPVLAQEQSVAPVINEFLANPEGADTDQEWVELYFTGDAELDLSGWEIFVDDKPILTFTTESILPQEYKVINIPGSKLPNCSSQPCSIRLSLRGQSTETDYVNYDHTTSGVSWSRMADNTWTENYANSPGAENLPPPPIIKTLLISEIYPSPNSGEEEWVEIFNWGTESVNLTNWHLDDLSNSSGLPDLVISPGQYILLSDLSISLNNTGDTISLIAPDGESVNTLKYEQIKKSESVARFGAAWETVESTNRPTPQAANLPRYVEVVQPPPTKKPSTQVVPPPAESPPPKIDKAPAYQVPLPEVKGLVTKTPDAQPVVKVNMVGLWLVWGTLGILGAREWGFFRRLIDWWQTD